MELRREEGQKDGEGSREPQKRNNDTEEAREEKLLSWLAGQRGWRWGKNPDDQKRIIEMDGEKKMDKDMGTATSFASPSCHPILNIHRYHPSSILSCLSCLCQSSKGPDIFEMGDLRGFHHELEVDVM